MRKKKSNPESIQNLIDTEWDILNDLKKMLADSELKPAERVRTANALAYHASVLNRLLLQKGESSQFDGQSLGDFIMNIEADVQPRITTFELRKTSRCARKDFVYWTRRLSSRR